VNVMAAGANATLHCRKKSVHNGSRQRKMDIIFVKAREENPASVGLKGCEHTFDS